MITRRYNKWYTDFYVNTERVRRPLKASSESDALREAGQLKYSLEMDQQASKEKIPYTLSDAFDRGFREHWDGVKTTKDLRGKADLICDYFGKDRQLATISEEHIREWVDTQVSEGATPATINRNLSLLSKLFKQAVHWGKDGRIVIDRVPYMPRQKEERNRRHRIVSDKELGRMVDALMKAPRPSIRECAPFFPVLMDLGCRLSEALQLTHTDIDWKSGTVIFWETKNGKPRRVPMTSRVKEELAGKEGRLFPYSKYRADKAWAYGREKIGLKDDKRFVIHALRHTCATKLLNKGASLEQVQAWLGHADITTTQIYAHYDTNRLQGLQGLLEG